jgi:hypothetical protein
VRIRFNQDGFETSACEFNRATQSVRAGTDNASSA